MKSLIKKLIPKQALSLYHLGLAVLANVLYGQPSRKMVVIGVTGTKGKTSTANFTWAALMGAGHKTGLLSTAVIRVGEDEHINDYHMTMLGRFNLQRWLRKMLDAGCTHVVVETSSEGILQWRHVGIVYDVGVFTNLSPEHLNSHGGSYDHYRKTKGRLFKAIANRKPKKINGSYIPTTTIVNADDETHAYYASFGADEQLTYGTEEGVDGRIAFMKSDRKTQFKLNGDTYTSPILGDFNAYNAAPGIMLASDATPAHIQQGLDLLETIPGRMEVMLEKPFHVIVDYAHEKVSMRKATEAAHKLATGKVIVLLGAEGGGRDEAKRGEMGRVVGELADIAIASNVDPYEDDPAPIAEGVAEGAREKGMKDNQNLFVILDRRAGMEKAFELAEPGDVLLFTGKGAEQTMTIDGKEISWDDRQVARELIDKNGLG